MSMPIISSFYIFRSMLPQIFRQPNKQTYIHTYIHQGASNAPLDKNGIVPSLKTFQWSQIVFLQNIYFFRINLEGPPQPRTFALYTHQTVQTFCVYTNKKSFLVFRHTPHVTDRKSGDIIADLTVALLTSWLYANFLNFQHSIPYYQGLGRKKSIFPKIGHMSRCDIFFVKGGFILRKNTEYYQNRLGYRVFANFLKFLHRLLTAEVKKIDISENRPCAAMGYFFPERGFYST